MSQGAIVVTIVSLLGIGRKIRSRPVSGSSLMERTMKVVSRTVSRTGLGSGSLRMEMKSRVLSSKRKLLAKTRKMKRTSS